MKSNKLVLSVLCMLGAYGCYWSYKHGPYDLSHIKLPDIKLSDFNIKQPDQKSLDSNNTIPPQFVPPTPKK